LYRGNKALDYAEGFVSWLRSREIQFRLVTNNATLTPTQYVAKLTGMGIGVHEDEIFTSALATAEYLAQQNLDGKSVLVVGEEGLHEALKEAGIDIDERRPAWVVVGLDRQVTYEKLSRAALALEAGARFLGTNPDTSLPTEQGLLPGAGAILAALTATTGIQPIVIGKPKPLMLELAMHHLRGSRADTAMLGDRLDTDIQAAAETGMPSILVLTGVSTCEDLAKSAVEPTLVVENLAQLKEEWETHAPRGGPGVDQK
jgi:4-nitrophenyl phosphatase